MGGWPLRQVHLQTAQEAHMKKLFINRRSVLGHDLGPMPATDALTIRRARITTRQYRTTSPRLRATMLGARITTRRARITIHRAHGTTRRASNYGSNDESKSSSSSYDSPRSYDNSSSSSNDSSRSNFGSRRQRKRACFRPGSGRLRDWTRFGVPRDFGPEGRSIWRSQ